MKKIILALLLISQVAFALNATYKGNKYALCMSEQYLDDWTGFIHDKDTESMKAYFGSKCIMLKRPVKVSGVDSHVFSGTASFIYKGQRLWGYYEGIER